MSKDEPKKIESTHIVNLRNNGITLKPGNKSKDDKIVIFGGRAINMLILGKIFLEICKMQEKILPQGDGTKRLINYLEEIRKEGVITENIRMKYNIQLNEDTIELNGKLITREVLGLLYLEMCKIQNLLYPHGKGSLYLAEYLDEVKNANAITPQIRTKFKV